jgi:hypothetical protein
MRGEDIPSSEIDEICAARKTGRNLLSVEFQNCRLVMRLVVFGEVYDVAPDLKPYVVVKQFVRQDNTLAFELRFEEGGEKVQAGLLVGFLTPNVFKGVASVSSSESPRYVLSSV